MGYRFLVAVVLTIFISACAAFNSDESTGGLKGPDGNVIVADSTFQGIYKGDKTLTANSCGNMKDEIGKAFPITLDVQQSAAIISVKFEDEEVVNGNIKDDKVELLKKGEDKSSIFSLQFKDKNITGKEEYFEGPELQTPCAQYELKLSKVEEKSNQQVENK